MTNATNWYAVEFKNWVKQCGSKPTAEMLQSIHDLGLRPGKQAIACAMGLRPEGVTNSQIALVCGNPQLNRMRGLIDDRLVKRLPASRNERNHTVYLLELTDKGKARIAGAQKRAAEAEAAGGVEPAIAAKRAATGAKPVKPETGKVLAKAAPKAAKAQRKAARKAAVKAALEPDRAANALTSWANLPKGGIGGNGPALAVDDDGNTVAISPSAALLPDNVMTESTYNDIDAGTYDESVLIENETGLVTRLGAHAEPDGDDGVVEPRTGNGSLD